MSGWVIDHSVLKKSSCRLGRTGIKSRRWWTRAPCFGTERGRKYAEWNPTDSHIRSVWRVGFRYVSLHERVIDTLNPLYKWKVLGLLPLYPTYVKTSFYYQTHVILKFRQFMCYLGKLLKEPPNCGQQLLLIRTYAASICAPRPPCLGDLSFHRFPRRIPSVRLLSKSPLRKSYEYCLIPFLQELWKKVPQYQQIAAPAGRHLCRNTHKTETKPRRGDICKEKSGDRDT